MGRVVSGDLEGVVLRWRPPVTGPGRRVDSGSIFGRVDDVFELDSDEFVRFVMDQWDWKQNFAETVAYSQHATRLDRRLNRRSGSRARPMPSRRA